jgi:RHS repeat-associated protein
MPSATGLPASSCRRPVRRRRARRAVRGAGGFAGTIGVRAEVAGLWEMRARFYVPHLGRFISPDPWPATLPGPATLNRYAYALNDPIWLVDPSGLFCWTGNNDAGKCRGVRDVAKRVSGPLQNVSTVFTAVSAVAVGLTVVCPPCAVATLPIAGSLQTIAAVSRGIAVTAGGISALAECTASGSITSFNCVKAVAGEAVGYVGGKFVSTRIAGLAERAVLKVAPGAVGEFGAGIFDVFLQGTSRAVDVITK